MIYNQNNAGSVKTQEIDGWKMGNLKQMVRDINGDGADQLIVPKELGRGGIWFPLLDMPAWPAIYRLDHGRYVEASRYFPVFYDTQVLPRLNEQIREAQARISREPFQQRTLAVLEMERDKVLRMLGRDPVAGLAQAYHWMNSEDPQVLQCAISTFSDIGGHDAELRISQRALESPQSSANKPSVGADELLRILQESSDRFRAAGGAQNERKTVVVGNIPSAISVTESQADTHKAAERIGRAFGMTADQAKASPMLLIGTPDSRVEQLRARTAWGVTQFIFITGSEKLMRLLAEKVLPHVA